MYTVVSGSVSTLFLVPFDRRLEQKERPEQTDSNEYCVVQKEMFLHKLAGTV
jgi:hypothetical protein